MRSFKASNYLCAEEMTVGEVLFCENGLPVIEVDERTASDPSCDVDCDISELRVRYRFRAEAIERYDRPR